MAADRQVSLEAVAALSARLVAGGTLDETLRHVCDAVVAEVDGAEEASITLVNERAAATYGATAGLPIAADERQYDAGRGPCLDAATGNQLLIVDDTHTDVRWRDVLDALAAAGVRSILSVPLPVQGESTGALNVYARVPAAFDVTTLETAVQLAGFAAVAVANAVAYADVSDRARNMQLAMASRAVIEQAKGVIMATSGCAADGAFELLVQQSQHENRKLREIATELVERTGRPGT